MKSALAILLSFSLVVCLLGCKIPDNDNLQSDASNVVAEMTTMHEETAEHGIADALDESQASYTDPTAYKEIDSSWESASERILPQLIDPVDSDFVPVSDYILNIVVDLQYATDDNFTARVIYDFTDAYLRYGTVMKLQAVNEELAEFGLKIKIWDGFRPISAQFKLWEAYPDANYVSNPNVGYSSHSKGNTVDLTLVDMQGNEIVMPTGFDDFSNKADRDYSDCSEEAANNAMLLQTIMERHGFSGYYKEWWHYSDTNSYSVEECFDPSLISQWYADCNEFISLRKTPSTSASVITRILVNEKFFLLGRTGNFAFVDFNGHRGYVLSSYIQPVIEEDEGIVPSLWIANCEEYISLRSAPGSSEVITRIPVGGTVTLKEWNGKYALVTYGSQTGYVLTSYIKPSDGNYFQTHLDFMLPTDCYTYEQMMDHIELLSNNYPQLISVETIGQSELGKAIPVVRLGNEDAAYHVLMQGSIHGREHMTTWLLIAMLDYWVDNDTQSLEDICFHVIPMSNPDGVSISQSGVLNDNQVVIYQSDKSFGYTDEEVSEYASLWKANGEGIDLNRNFSSGWESVNSRNQPSSQQFKGITAFSASESKALRDYTQRYDFDATVSYHAHGSIIYYGYGDKETVNSLSYELANEVGEITGYGLMGSEDVDGAGFKDWAIDGLEIPSITIEIGCQESPLAERECYSIFARNCCVFPTIANWLRV